MPPFLKAVTASVSALSILSSMTISLILFKALLAFSSFFAEEPAGFTESDVIAEVSKSVAATAEVSESVAATEEVSISAEVEEEVVDAAATDEATAAITVAGPTSASEAGLELLKRFEDCRLTAYKVLSTEKYYTIGWGHYGADVYLKSKIL